MGSERVEVPPVFEDAPVEHLIHLIADMLDRLMAHNDRIPLSPESLTRFHSRSAPAISVLDYLKRIVRFTNVEKSCLLITLYNIDQICARMPLFTLSSLTCHRFIITSITVSSKGLCDAFCPNNLYARVGGISVSELNVLEREFLSMIDWRLMCTREILQEYYVNLVRTHSAGTYYISGTLSPSVSEESDVDMDSGTSSPSSPTLAKQNQRPSPPEPTAVLIEPGATAQDVTQRATVEQNMAFAALQQSNDCTVERPNKRI
ncbi:cyclin-domain-containing protein [Gymnopilus junonius]|uniref:Cyclin-domain-containing protein n=1 Tax=Gymnopilus junonius TaxID=109634 RepID=A0A9P5NUF2_GYMJU|nr:cyclin-domain-containing protein [Gymnopilus junonius]